MEKGGEKKLKKRKAPVEREKGLETRKPGGLMAEGSKWTKPRVQRTGSLCKGKGFAKEKKEDRPRRQGAKGGGEGSWDTNGRL